MATPTQTDVILVSILYWRCITLMSGDRRLDIDHVSILYWRCGWERFIDRARELGEKLFQFSIGDASW